MYDGYLRPAPASVSGDFHETVLLSGNPLLAEEKEFVVDSQGCLSGVGEYDVQMADQMSPQPPSLRPAILRPQTSANSLV